MVTQPISRRYRTNIMSTKIKWICALVCYLYMLYLLMWNPRDRIPVTKGILAGILWEFIQIRKQTTNVPIYRMILRRIPESNCNFLVYPFTTKQSPQFTLISNPLKFKLLDRIIFPNMQKHYFPRFQHTQMKKRRHIQ